MVRLGLLLALIGLLLPAAAVFLLGAAAARLSTQQPTLVVPLVEDHADLTLMPGTHLRLSCLGASGWSASASDGRVLAAGGDHADSSRFTVGSVLPRRGDDAFDVPSDGRVLITTHATNHPATVLLRDAEAGPAPLAFAGALTLFASPLLLIAGSAIAFFAWWRGRRAHRSRRRRSSRKRRPAAAH